jgi:hypothetical protein
MYQFWAIFSQTLLVTLPETIHRIIPKALMHACMHACTCLCVVRGRLEQLCDAAARVGQSHVCMRRPITCVHTYFARVDFELGATYVYV